MTEEIFQIRKELKKEENEEKEGPFSFINQQKESIKKEEESSLNSLILIIKKENLLNLTISIEMIINYLEKNKKNSNFINLFELLLYLKEQQEKVTNSTSPLTSSSSSFPISPSQFTSINSLKSNSKNDCFKSPKDIEKKITPQSDESISSSIGSSWSTSSFQSPSMKFNFQTPQKIFHFEPFTTPKTEEKKNDESERDLDEETLPPNINITEKGISKSLFFDEIEKNEIPKKVETEEEDEGVEGGESKQQSNRTFSIGVAPTNIQKSGSKGIKKGSKKGSLFKQATHKSTDSQPKFAFSNKSIFINPTQNSTIPQETTNATEINSQSSTEPFSSSTSFPTQPGSDDEMEIGHTEDTVPLESTQFNPKKWNIPKTFNSAPETSFATNTVDPQSQFSFQFPSQSQPQPQNQSQNQNQNQGIPSLNKKKVNSALKKKSKSIKKGSGGDKEELSKIENTFKNINLNVNFGESGDKSPQKESSQRTFIFFPPENDTNTNTNEQVSYYYKQLNIKSLTIFFTSSQFFLLLQQQQQQLQHQSQIQSL